MRSFSAVIGHVRQLCTKRSTVDYFADNYVARLQGRGVIEVGGQDARDFLQGMVTNDMRALGNKNGDAIFAAILNAKGRIMSDTLISVLPEGRLAIEMDRAVLPEVLRHLKMYKLRKKVELRDADDMAVWSVMPGSGAGTGVAALALNSLVEQEVFHSAFVDPRWGELGLRVLGSASADEGAIETALPNYKRTHECVFTQRRLVLGVGEGAPLSGRIPLECNIEKLSGVSFSKGCYQGQELTARTHHQGIVRKRLLPITAAACATAHVADGASLRNGGGKKGSARLVGRLHAAPDGLISRGLAMVRLADVLGEDEQQAWPQMLFTEDDIPLRIEGLPPWWDHEPWAV